MLLRGLPNLKVAVKRACRWAPVLAWLTCILAGFYAITAYELTPGPGTSPSSDVYPIGATERPTDCWSLVMFVHPRCSCSRASVDELARVVEQARVPLSVNVWFFRPAGQSDDWARTELWTEVERIPNAVLRTDVGGEEAKRFGAKTSGQTFLYSPDGRLAFSGGITGSRGHFGDNPSSQRLAELLAGGDMPGQRATEVFGCPLAPPAGEGGEESR